MVCFEEKKLWTFSWSISSVVAEVTSHHVFPEDDDDDKVCRESFSLSLNEKIDSLLFVALYVFQSIQLFEPWEHRERLRLRDTVNLTLILSSGRDQVYGSVLDGENIWNYSNFCLARYTLFWCQFIWRNRWCNYKNFSSHSIHLYVLRLWIYLRKIQIFRLLKISNSSWPFKRAHTTVGSRRWYSLDDDGSNEPWDCLCCCYFSQFGNRMSFST